MTNPINLKIDGLDCVCVPLEDANFSDIAAIYIIICIDRISNTYKIIDIGQSSEVGTRLDTHDRKSCWKSQCINGEIWVCIYKMPSSLYTKQQRLDLERKLRSNHNDLCGDR